MEDPSFWAGGCPSPRRDVPSTTKYFSFSQDLALLTKDIALSEYRRRMVELTRAGRNAEELRRRSALHLLRGEAALSATLVPSHRSA